MRKKTLSKDRAVRALTDLAMKHLAKYPPAEQEARIRAYRQKVATFTETSAE
jgi:hypothetical protein